MAERSDSFYPHGPQNGQASRLHTVIWESRIRDYHHSLNEYLTERDKRALLSSTIEYIPAGQSEAGQYLMPNGHHVAEDLIGENGRFLMRAAGITRDLNNPTPELILARSTGRNGNH